MSAYSDLILAHGSLGAYYRLGESSGTTLDDSGPNHLDGSYSATPGITLGQTGLITNDADTAAAFDGATTTNAASVADNNSLDFGDGPMTFECWVKRGATLATSQTLLNRGSTALEVRFSTLDLIAAFKSGGAALATSSVAVTDTGRHHVVVVKNGATTLIYLDGVDVTVAGTAQTLSSTATIMRLACFSPTTQRFVGTMDEVALYAAVLSPADVLQHYNVARGILGQPSETDIAQSIAHAKAWAVAQNTEADTAQALTSQKAKALGQGSETDTAQSVAGRKSVAVGQATEADLAQSITRQGAIVVAIGQAQETDSALAITRAPAVTTGGGGAVLGGRFEPFEILRPRPQRVTLGLAVENDRARVMQATKTRTLESAWEGSATTVPPGKVVLIDEDELEILELMALGEL